MPGEWWSTAAAPLMTVVAVAGTVSAVWTLLQRTGRSRQHNGVVQNVRALGDKLMDFSVRLAGAGMPHSAGQYAFVRVGGAGAEEAHPFTIASACPQGNSVRFVVKALGDFTGRRLPRLLHPGQAVRLEGPYGQFDFQSTQKHQVWVAGGIGITPFMARLEALENGAQTTAQRTDFWLCVRNHEEAQQYQTLLKRCVQAGVHLHTMVDADGQRLSARHIADVVGDMRQASVWFCGPQGFGRSLRKQLVDTGLCSGDFHQEIFDMR